MTDRERFQNSFSKLHASADTVTEVLKMQADEKSVFHRIGRRSAVIALAAMLAVALGITALAASGVFSLNHRPAERGERFRLNFVEDQELYWDNAKLVFQLDGPETARIIRFKPGYLPAPATYTYPGNGDDGWFTRLTTERADENINQPCLIEVYYAPQYVNGGNLILLYDEPGEIAEETWGDYQVMKFETVRTIPGTDYRPERQLPGSYVLLYHQTEGHLIVISGQSPLSELERVARELQVESTEEVITAAEYRGENRFIDWGVG